jgi:histidine phosphotransferase ChpT
MAKDRVKLLLNLVASALTALPRGGEIEVTVKGPNERPSFYLSCRGTSARPPQHLSEFISGSGLPQLDALTIQPYYTWRLAQTAGMRLDVTKNAADVLISAVPA